MEISLKRKNNAYHFEAENASGNLVSFDANEQIGGQNKGIRPMEGVLASLAACSSIDVISILKKQKINPARFEVQISATRIDAVPAVFKTIHVKYVVSAEVDEQKLMRAIELSMTKYCSVTKMLEPTVNITYSHVIEN
ncbi:MAG: OsmC family protein [Flavobacteriales bacterium]